MFQVSLYGMILAQESRDAAMFKHCDITWNLFFL